MLLWHPNATRKIYSSKGKPWSGGSSRPKFMFHTTETTALPNYSAPPHMTLHPGVRLWQHIPFDLAAYSVRSGAVDTMQFVYQIEVVGRAREVPLYHDDPWYLEVADLIYWFHDNFGVPIIFEDFTGMKFGPLAAQRRDYATVNAFSGILGHAHVGRGIDSHWDPGRLDVPRLEVMLENLAPEEEMIIRDDKADNGLPVHKPSFQEAVDAGVMSRFTQPGGVAFNDEIATFLKRAGVFKIAALEARLAALEARDDDLQDGDTVKLNKV